MKKEFNIRFSVFVSICVSLFAFLAFQGTFTSGFHFVDNHEIINIYEDFTSSGNFFEVLSTRLSSDLSVRFRPVYMADNVVVDILFRSNILHISLFRALLHSCIIFFLFLSIRKLGFKVWESILFPVIVYVGVQSAIIWRLGPNETIGLWYFSLSLLCYIYAVKTSKNKLVFKVLYIIFGVLMMLSKESFLLMTPALMLAFIFIEKQNNRSLSWITIFRKRSLEFSVLIFAFIICLYFILFKMNTEAIGYAGIQNVDIGMYFKAFEAFFFYGMFLILIFYIVSVAYLYLRNKDKNEIKTNLFIVLIAVSILVPQVYLYGKSGIFERYYIPGVMAWALMLVVGLRNFRVSIRNKKSGLIFNSVFTIIFVIFITPLVKKTVDGASAFTYDGREINTFLELIGNNVSPNDTILFIADPVSDSERTYSLRSYIDVVFKNKNIHTKPIPPEHTDAYGQSLIDIYTRAMGGESMHYDSIKNKTDIKVIAVFPLYAPKSYEILKQLALNRSDYNSLDIGSYKLFFRKDNPVDSMHHVVNSLPPITETYKQR